MGIQTHVENIEPASWALMALAIILVVVRLTIRYTATRDLRLEDIMIGIALIMDIGATISLALAVQLGGLGKHRATLSAQQNDRRVKANYAQHILYLAILATAKISMTVFFRRLAVKRIHHLFTWALAVAIGAWWLSASLVVAFQCPLPHPWDPTAYPAGSCLPERIWLYVTVFDCVTEAAIVALPFWIVSGVRISRRKKAVVQGLFAVRVVVIAASITRYAASQARSTSAASSSSHTSRNLNAVDLQNLGYGPVSRASGGGGGGFDTSYDQTGYWLWTDLHSTITIIAACIPALKPFLEWSAGRINRNLSGFQRSTGGGGDEYSRNRKYGDGSGSGGGAVGSEGMFRMRAFSNGGDGGMKSVGGLAYQTTVGGGGRGESRESVETEGSGAAIVRQTKEEWDMQHDGTGSISPTATTEVSRERSLNYV
ncbi:hypothetical protein SLS56_005204 [Neofusicoccum ribis]|uniref:Rhodopsin domain-containing protein n=1 Tax=Neofusicoccum ribis TaxID=45134 RepID=A0ABR3SUW2_9PEZI